MKKEVALIGIAFLLIFGLVFADTIFFSTGSTKVLYRGTTKLNCDGSSGCTVNPGQTFTVFDSVDGPGGIVEPFDFFQVKVESQYWVQPRLKDYSDSANGTDGIWKDYGAKVQNKESHFANIYTYGCFISDSEQEGDGVLFHDYYIDSDCVTKYDKVKADFLARLNDSAPTGVLTASLVADKKTGDAPVDVIFDISGSGPDAGKTLTGYKLEFGDGKEKSDDWPTDATGLAALKIIKHSYTKSSTAKLIITQSDGEKKSMEVGITVAGTVSASCSECDNIVKCLACINKEAFVKGLFG